MTATLLWLTLGLPLGGGLVARLAGRRSGALAAFVGVLAAAPTVLLLVEAAGGSRARSTFAWLPGPALDVGLRLDPLSAAMAATVGLVGAGVLVYSAGYFAGAERAPSALAGILAFLAAMQGLVLADGYLALLFFWELVGMLSARLIAWNREDPRSGPGAVRAFLVTRTADFGLYAAVIALYGTAGTLAFGGSRPPGALGAVVGIGLVLAAVGKSAQTPVQTWLLGAMAGPTPVSALLHSATMVAAGVYLIVRSEPLLAGWPLEVAGWIGALTAVASALIALGQEDIKRVLAASTSSQIGLMFVGAAAGGPAVALFQLVAHATAKPALFLAAGVFQHDRGGTDLERLSGAGRSDRRAFAAFVVGAATIAAVPPLALFWSKDAVSAAAETANTAWFVLVLLAAAGSAAYMLRPTLILWRGRSGEVEGTGRVPMLAGCAIFALAALGAGVLGEPLARLLGEPPLPSSILSLVLGLAALAGGAAMVLFVRPPARARVAAARELYLPALLDRLVVAPVRLLATASAGLDRKVVDRAVDGAGSAALLAAEAGETVERRGIDALVDGLASLVRRGGERSREVQSGRLHEYLRDTVAGAAAVACLIVLTALL
ncbi:MAG: NADH-quinone oxidoreductase subunit L [Actinobacteria bacterium]|nr:NADH-quinone oxidoreductase subunit L [Actinomycetota bacterium]